MVAQHLGKTTLRRNGKVRRAVRRIATLGVGFSLLMVSTVVSYTAFSVIPREQENVVSRVLYQDEFHPRTYSLR